MEQRNDPRALGRVLLSMAIFGTIGLFRRLIDLPSSFIAFARGVIGAAFILLLLAVRRRRFQWETMRGYWPRVLLSGALLGFNWIMMFEAYRFTTVSVATLCYYMAPVLVVLLSPALLRERMSPRRMLFMALAVLGMLLVSGVLGSRIQGARGVALSLAAAGLYAAIVLMNKTVRGVPGLDKTLVQMLACAVVLLPYVLLTEPVASLAFTPQAVALLLVVGVVHTGVTYALYFSSMDGLRAQTVALASYIDPVVAVAVSALFLHEQMTALQWVGAALVLLATMAGEVLPERGTKA
ncbi:MAG: EamA family transporter [Oscillospiraceae bacterium]|nr:EamA family transporter [Oscillospiraceae bacterium]